MINFSFQIDYTSDTEFKNFWNRSWSTPLEHKFVELEIHTSTGLVGFNFDFTTKCDHAGLDIQLTVFGRTVHFSLYDHRHWNYKENCYSDGVEE
jgi:hypothetical protein